MKDDFAEITPLEETKPVADSPAEGEASEQLEAVKNTGEELSSDKPSRSSFHRNVKALMLFLPRFLPRKGSMLNLILVLTLITIVVAGMLGGVYRLTGGIIAENEQKKTNEALSKVFPGQSYTFEPLPDQPDVYAARDESEALGGYAISVSASGYGGAILLLTGFDIDGRVTGVEIISQRESRGFDKQGNFNYADGESFIGRFVENRGPFEVGRNIDGVSGATVSSKAIAAGVTEASEIAAKLLEADQLSLSEEEEVLS